MSERAEISPGELMKAGERADARGSTSGRVVVVLRVISALAFGLAISTAVFIVLVDLINCVQPHLVAWNLKSADPLILIGISFSSLQFVLPRTRGQRLLGLMVAVAFILWGAEQFLANLAVISFIDDIVVLLFVTDLSIVIFGNLKPSIRPAGKGLPFDEPRE